MRRRRRGTLPRGMLLAASDDSHEKVELLVCPADGGGGCLPVPSNVHTARFFRSTRSLTQGFDRCKTTRARVLACFFFFALVVNDQRSNRRG